MRIEECKNAEIIKAIQFNAFGYSEGPEISQLIDELFSDDSAKPILSLISIIDGDGAGSVVFSRINVESGGEAVKASILAPLGVSKKYQKQGVGLGLVEHGLKSLNTEQVKIVFVYGDPKYYERFGFLPVSEKQLFPPIGMKYPQAWQYINLCDALNVKALTSVTLNKTFQNEKLW